MLAELSITSTTERVLPARKDCPFGMNSGGAKAIASRPHRAMRHASSSNSFNRLMRYERRNCSVKKRVVEKRIFLVRRDRLRWMISGIAAVSSPIRNGQLRNEIPRMFIARPLGIHHLPAGQVGAEEGVEALVGLGLG